MTWLNDLVRLHKAIQEKLKATSYSEQNQILTFVKTLFQNLECTIQNILTSLNTLFELYMKLKKQVEYQQNQYLKKGKTITTETLHLEKNVYEETISVGRCLKRKAMLVRVKEYIINNFATCKILCNLQKLHTAFIEKHPNVIGFSKLCSGQFKNDSLCLRWQRSSKCYVASQYNELRLDIQRPDQEDRLQH